ncbi:MAG TPA: YdbL family protein [Croceibacterium sp.]|nr:YdbL family protein [Croceibacterium sp.]
MALISQRTFAKALVGGLLLAGLAVSAPASAQRDPAYQAARAAGQIGEQIDGYLGVVGSQPAAIQNLVSDLNNRRRENYAAKAQEQKVTLQEYAITQGCLLIARTQAGERYQAPDGSWQTRGAGAPARLAKCP